ncbi:MAG: histidine kinase [Chitinophagales bacterium]|nr:histidine kinase [Chitinophagales bacterium]
MSKNNIEILKNKLIVATDFREIQETKLLLAKLLILSNVEEALVLCNEIISVTEHQKEYHDLFYKANAILIRHFAHRGNFDKITQLNNKISLIKHPNITIDTTTEVEFSFMFIYKYLNKLDDALVLGKKLLEENYKFLNKENKINFHLHMGELYMKLTYKDLAAEELNKGLQLFEEDEETQDKANFHFTFGMLMYEDKKYEIAINQLNKAKEIELKNEGRAIPKAQIFAMLARCYMSINNKKKMLASNSQAQKYALLSNNPVFNKLIIGEQIDLFVKVNKIKEAIEIGNILRKDKEYKKNDSFYYGSLNMLAAAYLKQKNIDESIACAKKCSIYYKKTERKLNLRDSYEILMKCYEEKKDFINLAAFQKKYILLLEDLNKEKEHNAIEQFEIKYKTAENEIEIEKQKSESIKFHLQALRSQMNPHFIFNAIDSVVYNMDKGEFDKSKQLLASFARLMRANIEFTEQANISLEEEIRFLKDYLVVEQSRLHQAFDFEINYHKDLEIDFIELPSMLLQLFVENAIKHGIMPLTERKGKIELTFEDKDDMLLCTITDNGIGRKKAKEIRNAKSHLGKSTKIIAERLRMLEQHFSYKITVSYTDLYNKSKQAAGTSVQISIPI